MLQAIGSSSAFRQRPPFFLQFRWSTAFEACEWSELNCGFHATFVDLCFRVKVEQKWNQTFRLRHAISVSISFKNGNICKVYANLLFKNYYWRSLNAILFCRHRIPIENWWLKLRPLLRILAKHDSVYETQGVEEQFDEYTGVDKDKLIV